MVVHFLNDANAYSLCASRAAKLSHGDSYGLLYIACVHARSCGCGRSSMVGGFKYSLSMSQVYSARSMKSESTDIISIAVGTSAGILLCVAGTVFYIIFRRRKRKTNAAKKRNVRFRYTLACSESRTLVIILSMHTLCARGSCTFSSHGHRLFVEVLSCSQMISFDEVLSCS